MQHGHEAGYGAKTTKEDGHDKSGAAKFPKFPGDNFLAHAGAQYKEAAETALALRSLLAVAQGQQLESATSIVDIDLTTLPELPVTHRDHERRKESRIRVAAQNQANAAKRYTLMMTAWTEIYALLKESTVCYLCV